VTATANEIVTVIWHGGTVRMRNAEAGQMERMQDVHHGQRDKRARTSYRSTLPTFKVWRRALGRFWQE
jgi:hypothetical protein